MAENITLQIYTPEKLALNCKVYRVQIPYGKMNLTIIEDRAPTSLVLHAGVVRILNHEDNEDKAYFIDGGVADIADNVCKISTRYITDVKSITLEEARQHCNQEPENALYYQCIINYLENFGSAKG